MRVCVCVCLRITEAGAVLFLMVWFCDGHVRILYLLDGWRVFVAYGGWFVCSVFVSCCVSLLRVDWHCLVSG